MEGVLCEAASFLFSGQHVSFSRNIHSEGSFSSWSSMMIPREDYLLNVLCSLSHPKSMCFLLNFRDTCFFFISSSPHDFAAPQLLWPGLSIRSNKILDTFALFTTSTIEVKCVDTNKAPLKGFHVNHMGGFVGQQRAMVAFNCGKTKASWPLWRETGLLAIAQLTISK